MGLIFCNMFFIHNLQRNHIKLLSYPSRLIRAAPFVPKRHAALDKSEFYDIIAIVKEIQSMCRVILLIHSRENSVFLWVEIERRKGEKYMSTVFTASSVKKIRFVITEELRDALTEVLPSIPQYHCIRDFVADCISRYNRSLQNYIESGDAEADNGDITFTYRVARMFLLSESQIAFLRSEDADRMFPGEVLQEDFLEQLRDTAIPKAR